METDLAKVAEAAKALTIADESDVRGNLTLPTAGLNGATITWRSSKPAVITGTGEVTRPQYGSKPARLTLVATLKVGSMTRVRAFRPVVVPLPKPEPLKGYSFAYFTGEGSSDGEQIHFAASRGNDPLTWDEINGGKPVLTSDLGEKGVRDPFVMRSPEGDKFYLIATDLKIYQGNGWDASQRTGSRSLMVWESTDLVSWSDQRMVQVSLDGGTAVLYADGVEMSRRTDMTTQPGAIGAGRTTANFLGRSLYAADNSFKGRMRDVRIYNRHWRPARSPRCPGTRRPCTRSPSRS